MRRRREHEPTPEEIRAATPEHPSTRVKMPDYLPPGHQTVVRWDAEKMCDVETVERYGYGRLPRSDARISDDPADRGEPMPDYDGDAPLNGD